MNQQTSSRFTPLALMALALALGVLLFTALSPSGQGTLGASVDTAEAAGKTVTINIADYKYSKTTLTIKKGQKVKWVNKDTAKHDAHSDKSGGPKGPLLGKGESYTWTAKKTGTFNYYCTPHKAFMKAKIIVK